MKQLLGFLLINLVACSSVKNSTEGVNEISKSDELKKKWINKDYNQVISEYSKKSLKTKLVKDSLQFKEVVFQSKLNLMFATPTDTGYTTTSYELYEDETRFFFKSDSVTNVVYRVTKVINTKADIENYERYKDRRKP
jgi:hypothetical protein